MSRSDWKASDLVSRQATGVIDRTVWLCVEGVFPGRFPISGQISTVEVLDGREAIGGSFSGCRGMRLCALIYRCDWMSYRLVGAFVVAESLRKTL